MRRESWAEPWRVKVVESLRITTHAEREDAIREAGYNTSLLRSENVYIDLLTDSGTSAMSDRQWAGMMLGDEAHAGSRNFYSLQNAVLRYYGYPHLVPTHQGRGAEHILSRILISPGDHVPGNMYFTTTRAHQELAGGTFHDVIIDEAHDPASEHPFKGNVDLAKLDAVVQRYGALYVLYISVAATVNMAGGQPVSLANLREVREYARAHGIMVVLDATRAVENAWFIQQREAGQRHRRVADILREMCDLTDGATMSGKKDSLVNIGGWLGLRDELLAERARNLVVVYEGLHTYGGLAGRDMEAMAIGIEEPIQEDHIELVRLTVPRRVCTQAHMDVTAESVAAVYEARDQVRGLRFTYEPDMLRFFQARFEPVDAPVTFGDTNGDCASRENAVQSVNAS
jgi:tyrosine phenol-lyase